MDIRLVSQSEIDYSKMPLFIYNRYDLWGNDVKYIVLDVGKPQYLEVYFDNNCAILGSIMWSLSKSDIKTISNYIFVINKNIKRVKVQNNTCFFIPSYKCNYFTLTLPSSYDDLFKSISSKHKRNMKEG